MQYTIQELWAMITDFRKQVASLNAYIAAQKMSRDDANVRMLTQIVELEAKCKKQAAGLRVMSDTVSWLTDNQRIF